MTGVLGFHCVDGRILRRQRNEGGGGDGGRNACVQPCTCMIHVEANGVIVEKPRVS